MHHWGNKKDMTGDDPSYLSVGTEVSAKYKGAFCEAKIRKVVKSVKCKVQYKNEQGFVFVNDDQIKGLLMPGASVEVKLPDKKEGLEGVIVKVQDLSQYTVVFDDGDIATLRRTALCLKSGRHFAESETLDQLPLTHPEHFSTPVVSGSRGSRRRDDMDESDDEEKLPKIEREEDMGKVVCVEIGDKKKSKDNWFPGLVVAPNAQDSIKIDVEEEYLVRSFKDGRYYTVPKNETTDFTRDMGTKVENVTLKQAVEKAILFLDKNDLPAHWDREQLFRQGESSSDTDASDTDSMDDEPREEKDHFVAQLYKFMDDRGTPINKGPVITSKDVDLYKLFKIVYKSGGYNRVTNRNQWKNVSQKLGFTVSQTNNVKTAYKKYLHSFEDFYRKLGCTLLTRTDNKLRSRSSRPLIRDRDKSAPDKLLLDKDENSSSANEDTADVKESTGVKMRIAEPPAAVEESNFSRSSSDAKKENTAAAKIRTRDPSTESITDNRKTESNATKDTGLVQFSIKDLKEEKLPATEKRVERKSTAKLIPKVEESVEKKYDKASSSSSSLKTTKSGKKAKPVEKRIKKTETALTQMKEKRSLKDRMKAIVHKLKLKSAGTNDQKKKKQKPDEEFNKFISQGLRIKLKDEFACGGIKSRKLSAGSNDSKSAASGQSNDKRIVTGLIPVGGGVNEMCPSNSMFASKVKKNEEEGSDQLKRKSTSRKKKDDDKSTSCSSESRMYEAIDFLPHYKSICIGDKLRVYYEPTHESKITYEAKVTNKRLGSGAVSEYLVHYTGWNTRYDEWIRRSRIADNLSWTPSRAKRKLNQLEMSPSGQTTTTEKSETQIASNPTVNKSERSKRGSQSPITKNRSKVSINKNGAKQMKIVKAQLDSKSKKMSVHKGSDNGSESEDENNQKQNALQKTRSRTEKQKQQDEESTNARDAPKDTSSSDAKKKTTPASLKRTRSGSVKSESKNSTKKRKMSPSTETKSGGGGGKSSAIRNAIIKSLVPRKRASARTKESKDDLKDVGDTSPPSTDAYDSKMEEENEDTFFDDVKPLINNLEKGVAKTADEKLIDDKKFVVKLTPISCTDRFESLATSEPDTSNSSNATSEEIMESSTTVATATAGAAHNEESGPPPLKKAISTEELSVVLRVSNAQTFADSYLAENLEIKPKVTKTKLKKDLLEEKGGSGGVLSSPSKVTNRSPCGGEKLTLAKPVGEVKEKTIFTSRSPSEKKIVDRTPEKDGKLRNVSTYTSYLNMEKIDALKKSGGLVEKVDKTTDKSAVVAEAVNLASGKSVDDIYEFNEPEPVAIDDRAILHRRATSRIFEESPVKRIKFTNSSSADSAKETDDSAKPSEDASTVETKGAATTGADLSEAEREAVVEKRAVSEQEDNAEERLSDDEALDEELSKTDVITLESAKSIILPSSPVDCRLRDSPVPTVSKTKYSKDSKLNKNDDDEEDDEDEDEDGDDSKLVILETDQTAKYREKVGQESCAAESKMAKTDAQLPVSAPEEEVSIQEEEEEEEEESGSSDEGSRDEVTKKTKSEDKLKLVAKKSSSQYHSDDCNGKNSSGGQKNFSSHEEVLHGLGAAIDDDKDTTVVSVKKDKNSADKTIGEGGDQLGKYEEENDGLLLCEETIPKSPEAKDASDDMEVDYPCVLRGPSSMEIKKVVDPQLARVKKESRSSSFASPNDTPPTTPEGTNSTPGTSPSEEVSGFSSATFSLNEKSGSNKDSSENETSSDTSEKLAKIKRYSEETYAKKNAFEFDTYLKNQAEPKDQKSEETTKKKTKSLPDTLVNETDKDDDATDVSGSTTRPESASPKAKLSIAYILALIPTDFDSSQRIEFLEQKQEEIRRKYMHYKQEVAIIDRKRKKLRRKQREGRMMTRNEANSLLA